MPRPEPAHGHRRATCARRLAALLAGVLLLLGRDARAQSGVLDPTFGTAGVVVTPVGNGDDFGRALAIQDDDRILVAGTCKQANDDFCLLRYLVDGTLDTSLGGTGKVTVPIRSGVDQAAALALQSDHRILLAGFSTQASKDEFAVARFLPSGALDPAFDGDGVLTTAIGSLEDRARAVGVQSDGKIVVAGYSLTQTNRDVAVVRYDASGALDPQFGSGGKLTLATGTGNDEAAALVIQPDDRIVLAGYAADGTQSAFMVTRLLAGGAPDPSFNGGAPLRIPFGTGNAFGNAVALQQDGKIVIAGYARVGTVYHFALARVDANGNLDPGFDGDGRVTTPIGSTSQANAVAVDPTGRLVVAGVAHVAGNDDVALARYDTDGSLDGNFAGGFVTLPIGNGADEADGVAAQRDGKIVVAGSARNANDDNVAVARYLIDDCGNGVLDPGEECDGGALIDGDCCSSACTILPAGALCRPIDGACDIPDYCDGTSSVCPDARKPDADHDGVCDELDDCPDVADPLQADDDHDGLGNLCDPCTNGVVVGKPKIRITKYTTGPGDDAFSFTGTLDFASAPQLDPIARGARVLLADGTGAALFDVTVPPGAYSPLTRTGWQVNRAATAFTFRATEAVGGVIGKLKLSFTTARPDLVKFTMSGTKGGFATSPVALPFAASVVLDPPTAQTGLCGEISFTGPPPAPVCALNRSGSTLGCK